MIGLPSSGLHSNGYSLARKALLEQGRLKLPQRIAELGRTLAEEMIEPTRIYAKIARKLFSSFSIKGAAHITGGGIVGNLPRILPSGKRAVLERGSWPVPPIFRLIQKIGRVAQGEMDTTFNNGLGMIFVVAKTQADALTRSLKALGEKAYVLGEIRNGRRGVTLRA